MHLNTPLFTLLRLIYPLPEKNLTRDRPLQVLALGISRSGTESLRQALIELDFDDCHHGFRYITDPSEILQWVRLALAQRAGDKPNFAAEEFDKCLGDCRAVTDTPSCGFANELLDAYPEAKETIEKHNYFATWSDWLLTFFDSTLFWNHGIGFFLFWQRLFGHDFKRHGKAWYRQHYANLEARLEREGRGYLNWKVEDGWEPLCRYLDKPTPSEYEARMYKGYMESRANATRNLRTFVAIVIGVGALLGVGRFLW